MSSSVDPREELFVAIKMLDEARCVRLLHRHHQAFIVNEFFDNKISFLTLAVLTGNNNTYISTEMHSINIYVYFYNWLA